MKHLLIACLTLVSSVVRTDAQIIFNKDPNAIPGMTSPLAPVIQPQAAPAPTQPQTPIDRINALRTSGSQLLQAGQMQDALNAYATAYQEIEKHFGAESKETALAKLDVAVVLRHGANYKEAMAWGEAAVGLLQKVGEKKKQTLEYGLAVQKLGEMYMDVGENAAAYKACQESSIILEKQLPERDPRRITALHDLGVAEGDLGYPEMEDHLREALALREEVMGPDSIPVAYTAVALGRNIAKTFRFEEAETLMQRSLTILKAHVTQEAPMTLRAMGDLVTHYSKLGKINKLEAMLREKTELLKQTVGEDHDLGDSAFRAQAKIHLARSQFEEAEQCIFTSLERVKKHWGERSPAYAAACGDAGELYAAGGMEEKAERYFLTAHSIIEDTSGQETEHMGSALVGIGSFFLHRREPNYLQAYDCIIRGLNILAKIGRGHAMGVDIDLAEAAHQLGRDDQAKKILLTTLQSLEDSHSISSTEYLKALGLLFQCTGNQNAQLDALKRCIKLVNEDLAKKSEKDLSREKLFQTLCNMNTVAGMTPCRHEPAETTKWAQRLIDFSLQHFPENNEHIRSGLILLASAAQDQNQLGDAQRLVREWLQKGKSGSDAMLSVTGGLNRGTMAAPYRPYNVAATYEMPEETALLLMQNKGMGLQLNLLDHQFSLYGKTEEGRPLWEKLANLRSEYVEQFQLTRSELSGNNIRDQIREIETTLSKRVNAEGTIWDNLDLNLSQLDAAIPSGAAVLDYFEYSHRSPGGTYKPSYGIVVLKHGQKPALFHCTEGRDKVNEMAGYFTIAMGSPGKKPRDKDKALNFLCRTGYETFIKPIEKELAGIKTLYVCPEHTLQFLPFSVLLDDDGHFLVERFSVRYLNSTRDLLRHVEPAKADQAKEIFVFGAATYQERLTALDAVHPTTLQASENKAFLEEDKFLKMEELPAAEHEIEFIKKQADTHHWKPRIYRDDEASEAKLRALDSPAVLHLATHGYFIPDPAIAAYERRQALMKKDSHYTEGGKTIDVGFFRTGLLLAKAKDSLDFWSRDYMLPREDDGILRAEEICGLNLRNTRLAFLSNCDPGEIDASSAGLPNLRAAFLHAGVQNLILTAWPVKDAGAASFVGEFYDRYFASGDAAGSLEATQREWLLRVKEQDGLWEALRQAGGYMLTTLRR